MSGSTSDKLFINDVVVSILYIDMHGWRAECALDDEPIIANHREREVAIRLMCKRLAEHLLDKMGEM